jgi:hypothetical protein
MQTKIEQHSVAMAAVGGWMGSDGGSERDEEGEIYYETTLFVLLNIHASSFIHLTPHTHALASSLFRFMRI